MWDVVALFPGPRRRLSHRLGPGNEARDVVEDALHWINNIGLRVNEEAE